MQINLFADYYRQLQFDPYRSGDFDFVQACVSIPEYSTALVLYLTTLQNQYELYSGNGEFVVFFLTEIISYNNK